MLEVTVLSPSDEDVLAAPSGEEAPGLRGDDAGGAEESVEQGREGSVEKGSGVQVGSGEREGGCDEGFRGAAPEGPEAAEGTSRGGAWRELCGIWLGVRVAHKTGSGRIRGIVRAILLEETRTTVTIEVDGLHGRRFSYVAENLYVEGSTR